ncbi:MAG: DUF1150 family protein [Alphaproteobacteria bacterium]|nr:DUF1150 family protein [Alphaproteobacteria bacterium]
MKKRTLKQGENSVLFEQNEEDVAFVKFAGKEEDNKWFVCSADGTKIAETDSREIAFILARQNDFDPCSAH